ncbi:Aste57867_683 [Aphanomyces stellatus]|uniref:Aste57867_683 protein n=1 Tax=Aphanomyces stellatus TaxID=120398 RepID=A0A485K496_9STRA|nr:hypothetical protein As57867_000682 [Aphanomyces stellatus]VFT77908.1 Aste57867_683 [Aphanomyces stellatus]
MIGGKCLNEQTNNIVVPAWEFIWMLDYDHKALLFSFNLQVDRTSSITMRFPTLKVTYFDMAGRAEMARLALVIGDVPFEDERLAREDWMALKPTVPFKQLPLLTVDGQVLTQSSAISRYAAILGGVYPTTNPLDACRVDEIVAYREDVFMTLLPTLFEQDANKKKAMREEQAATKLPEMFCLLEARLGVTSSGPWFLDSISQADLAVYTMVGVFKSGLLDGIPLDICDKYNKIMAIFNAVHTHPKVAAWNDAHIKAADRKR